MGKDDTHYAPAAPAPAPPFFFLLPGPARGAAAAPALRLSDATIARSSFPGLAAGAPAPATAGARSALFRAPRPSWCAMQMRREDSTTTSR